MPISLEAVIGSPTNNRERCPIAKVRYVFDPNTAHALLTWPHTSIMFAAHIQVLMGSLHHLLPSHLSQDQKHGAWTVCVSPIFSFFHWKRTADPEHAFHRFWAGNRVLALLFFLRWTRVLRDLFRRIFDFPMRPRTTVFNKLIWDDGTGSCYGIASESKMIWTTIDLSGSSTDSSHTNCDSGI